MNDRDLATAFWRAMQFGILAAVFLSSLELSPAFASGHAPIIRRLPKEQCSENLSVLAPQKPNDDSAFADDCVLSFTHPGGTGDWEGTEALMRLDGSDVRLRKIQKTARYPMTHYEFVDGSGAVKVVMDVKENCPKNVEGCDFSGWLVVKSPQGSSKIHVVYYRGG